MDFTVLYTSSPDWIKALMVILPHVTLLGVAWLALRRPARPLPPVAKSSATPVAELLPAPVRLDIILSEEELQAVERNKPTLRG